MAENSELHKDKNLVKRVEAFQRAIDYADRLGLFISPPPRDDPFTGSRVANKYFRELQKETGKLPVVLDTSKRNRAVRAFVNQTGPEFVEPIINWYDQFYQRGNLDPSYALNQIYNRESSLRAPAKTGSGSGTEAHHQIALSTADRLRNMPVADQLHTFSLARANGFPVGTYPEEMLMLSRWSHQGDPIGVTAHTDPVRFMPGIDSSINQGAWKSEPFPAGTSPQEAVARLADETFQPQSMMNSLAFNRQDEAQARDIMRQIAGGDLWTPDLKERASLAKNVEAAGKLGTVIDMNHYVRNPTITEPIRESELSKYLKKGNAIPVRGGITGGLASGAALGILMGESPAQAIAGNIPILSDLESDNNGMAERVGKQMFVDPRTNRLMPTSAKQMGMGLAYLNGKPIAVPYGSVAGVKSNATMVKEAAAQIADINSKRASKVVKAAVPAARKAVQMMPKPIQPLKPLADAYRSFNHIIKSIIRD